MEIGISIFIGCWIIAAVVAAYCFYNKENKRG